MGQTAHAAVLRRRDEAFEIEELEFPDLGHGQILVKVVAAGLCHTDLLLREGQIGGDMPFVLGHEGAGIVEDTGPGATGVAIGDHVVLTFDSCGACANCLSGHPAYCDTFMVRNFFGVGLGDVPTARTRQGEEVATRWFGQSSFADYAIATPRNAIVVDPNLPLELAGPLGCSVMTGAATVANVLGARAGQSVAVLGVGTVGLAGIMAAVDIGASRIVAVDREPSRLTKAKSLGATHLIGAEAADGLAQALLDTGGPFSGVLDTTGHPGAIAAGVEVLAPRGTCAVVGHQHGDLVLGPRALNAGKRLTAVYEGDVVPQIEIPRLATLWRQGRLPLEQLVTTYSLSNVNEAEREFRAGSVIKPILLP